jgi:hypothetical protein
MLISPPLGFIPAEDSSPPMNGGALELQLRFISVYPRFHYFSF